MPVELDGVNKTETVMDRSSLAALPLLIYIVVVRQRIQWSASPAWKSTNQVLALKSPA